MRRGRNDSVVMADWLVGSWRLVSCVEHGADGSITYPMGPDAVGQLIYDCAGRMSAQMAERGQSHFADDDPRRATEDEKAAAWSRYFGYFGTYTIDETSQTVTHHIEGSGFPNLAGTDQVRKYRRDGRRLILEAETAWGQVSAQWEKIVRDPASASNLTIGTAPDGSARQDAKTPRRQDAKTPRRQETRFNTENTENTEFFRARSPRATSATP